MPDPRKRPHECDHLLIDIISIAILAVICGADEITALETFGQHARSGYKLSWPCRTAFRRTIRSGGCWHVCRPGSSSGVFAVGASIARLTAGEVVAIDGKTLRRSHTRGQGQGPLALVSAGRRPIA
ncbi:MAG: transposase family protein [Blastocatellia bacterium]